VRLRELLGVLDEFPNVLVVFNHPLWTQSCVGVQRGPDDLDRFLSWAVQFLHAFEINAARGEKENQRVRELAAKWNRPLVSGGDRHGCEASGALNLTSAETFCEFVSEIRREQRSHVLLMPQYSEPLGIRTTRTLLDIIRNYPEYPMGSRRWDDRIFHPDENGGAARPISALWEGAAGIRGGYSVVHPMAGKCRRAAAVERVFQAGDGVGKSVRDGGGDCSRRASRNRSGFVGGAGVRTDRARVAFFPASTTR